MRIQATIVALVLLSACDKAPQPGPVHDTSMTPPPSASVPAVPKLEIQPITMQMAEKFDLSGAGCTFVAAGGKDGEWTAVTRDNEAWFMTGGKLIHLTAPMKPGEAYELARDRYDGEGYGMRIVKGPGPEKVMSEEYTEQEGSLSILDGSGAEVFQAKGILGCGS